MLGKLSNAAQPARVSRALSALTFPHRRPQQRQPQRGFAEKILRPDFDPPAAVEDTTVYDNSFVEENGKKWRVVSGVIIERTPRLTHPRKSWMVEWQQFQDELDINKRKKMIPLDWILSTRNKEELLNNDQFDPSPRIQPSDISDDRRSINRALVDSTFLIVKRKRDANQWRFPQGMLKPTDTIRKAAERRVKEECGAELDSYFLGNAPIGHVAYEHAEGGECVGSKVFLMHSVYLGGDVEIDDRDIVDFAWVRQEEFPDYFSGDMLELLRKVIYVPVDAQTD
jgi:8-oxo-dGTP pyrophosphatase MutT (NUDIX family)